MCLIVLSSRSQQFWDWWE